MWKYIGVGNPCKRPKWLTVEKAKKNMLGVLRGAGHLHSLGVVHGDLSMSNVLVKKGYDVRVADFGAVTGHTLLTDDKLCVSYIRPPEAILGSDTKGTGVDAWAMAVTALALSTGMVPTFSRDRGRGQR